MGGQMALDLYQKKWQREIPTWDGAQAHSGSIWFELRAQGTTGSCTRDTRASRLPIVEAIPGFRFFATAYTHISSLDQDRDNKVCDALETLVSHGHLETLRRNWPDTDSDLVEPGSARDGEAYMPETSAPHENCSS
ncbi:hypothetical protein PG996_009215 [Apiospora saccharicola]|uniref:Solute-binding protein family 3/N-terminal domain-containing protein n=1 Tax=Apiospora saccharicola TaxID=335842 RepID=A0ABR1UMJ6_9PEZI